MNGEATRFKIGNKAAEKWDKKSAIEAFQGLIDFAIAKDDIYSLQQAYIEYQMPASTYYHLLDKFAVLENYKKHLNDVIIARVNKGAIEGDYSAAPAIWRMKQLGEKDKTEQDLTIKEHIKVIRPKKDAD